MSRPIPRRTSPAARHGLRTALAALPARAVAQSLLGGAFVASMGMPMVARADCIADAALRHGVNADVLRAIGWQESRLDPAAVAVNRDGSIDRGAFQINSVHLPRLARFGIDAGMLADGCVSAEVAAWHYRSQVDRYGNTWAAVGAYHSRTPARQADYARRIATILVGWHVLAPVTAAP